MQNLVRELFPCVLDISQEGVAANQNVATSTGPLLRIGPKEVSFYSLDVYDTVHKVGSKFVKDPRTYGEFVQGGHPALFSIAYVLTRP